MNTKNSSTHIKKYKLILSAVHMVYRLINSTYNINELILRLTRLLCQFINASYCVICVLDTDKKKVIAKAIFNNKINILITKKKELAHLTPDEKRVISGYSIFRKNLIALPLVADDNIGAIYARRNSGKPAFTDSDMEMLSVVAEQSVTAIRNIQLSEQQQRAILGSIKFIGKLLAERGYLKTNMHTPEYFQICKQLAEKLNTRQEVIDSLYYASVLRDAGAIDIPYEILAKRSQLTAEEFKIIREHPARSAELIRPVEFLRPVLPIILYHHEKYDGTGYPSGLKKEQIPIGARLMAVVDAFEAMTGKRPYKRRLSIHEAIEELKENSGTQFDPRIVEAFIRCTRHKKFRNYLSLAKK